MFINQYTPNLLVEPLDEISFPVGDGHYFTFIVTKYGLTFSHTTLPSVVTVDDFLAKYNTDIKEILIHYKINYQYLVHPPVDAKDGLSRFCTFLGCNNKMQKLSDLINLLYKLIEQHDRPTIGNDYAKYVLDEFEATLFRCKNRKSPSK